MLFVGTEHGVYCSTDAGENLSNLSLNLPSTPVMGIEVKNNDLVIATHGRSFWILDNIGALRQMSEVKKKVGLKLFKPTEAVRRSRRAVFDFHLQKKKNQVKLVVKNEQSEVIRVIYEGELGKGFHRKKWNLRHKGATVFPNIILEGGNPRRGPWAVPGSYIVSLEVNGKIKEQTFELKKDPRLTDVSQKDLEAQFELAMNIRNAENAANQSIIKIRNLTNQLKTLARTNTTTEIAKKAELIDKQLRKVEEKIYQVRNQSPKDKIAFPIQLNDRLTGLRSRLEKGDGAPPKAFYQVYDELSGELNQHLSKLKLVLEKDLVKFNELLEEAQLPKVY